MPPALIVVVDDPQHGIPGVTDDPALADALLVATLAGARRVAGVGRVLLFHPAELEGRLSRLALGYRLWPQDGATPGQRYANAFRQAADLGYEGAVVIGTATPAVDPTQLTEAALLLESRHGAIAPDGRGGVAMLALQEPQPNLLTDAALPRYDDVRARAAQQRIDLVEMDAPPAPDAGDLDGLLGERAR